MYINRTNIPLGDSGTILNNAWEAQFKQPLNDLISNTQDLNYTKKRVVDLRLSYVDATTISVNAGFTYDETKKVLIKIPTLITATFTNLDAGTVAANTWYYVFLTQDSNTNVEVKLSTSETKPLLSSGYTYKKLIGVIKTDNNSDIVPFWVFGISNKKEFNYAIPQIVATALDFSNLNVDVRSSVPISITKQFVCTTHLYIDTLGSGASGTSGYTLNISDILLRTPYYSTTGLKFGDISKKLLLESNSDGFIELSGSPNDGSVLFDIDVNAFVVTL